MSDWKPQLEAILATVDASASGLDAEAREAAQHILSEASACDEAEALLQELDVHYPVRAGQEGIIPARAYLRGRILLELGRLPEALESLLPLCAKLEQANRWADLAAVADEILQLTANLDAARHLAKAAEQAGADITPPGSLQRAFESFPDEHRIGWLVAEGLERAGDAEAALAIFTGCLPALVEGRHLAKIEEVFLRLEEHADAETTETVLKACIRLAGLKEWKTAETYLEPLLPRIKAHGLARQAWDLFLKILPKAPAQSNLRRFMIDIAPDALPDVDGVLDLLARSGILDPKVKVETALRKLDEFLEFAPGYRVLHHGWGTGRIRVNEGNALIIDFAGRPGHRMALALARNALTVIPADDLRVYWTETADRVREMVRTQPAEIAYLAIRELGGRATVQELRRRLTAEIIPPARWSTWWKDARTAMETDARLDLSEGFRQTYTIRKRAAGDDPDLLFPHLDPRRGVRANLNLLRRFLDQHPEHHEQTVRMYVPILTRWLRDERIQPEPAMAICLLLQRWGQLNPQDLQRSLKALLTSGVEATVFADEADQRFVAEQAFLVKDLERPAILFALGSRYDTIHALALARMQTDPAGSETLVAALLNHPEDRPQTAFALIWMIISEDQPKPAFLPSPWVGASALCRLVERSGRDTLRTQAMRLFSSHSALARALRTQPAPDEVRTTLEDVLKRWRESERFLFPILAFFEELGLGDIVERVSAERSAATNRFLRTPDSEDGRYAGLFLTRASYARLEQERDQLAWELKNTVAQAIQRAREHGDLSENAEYEAAKEKQAKHARRIVSINEMLSKATLIENVQVPSDEVGPGCRVEVRLAPVGDRPAARRTFWLLGEGDSNLSPEVVSCSSPIGRILLGRRVGDEVELELADGPWRASILASERKLPQEQPTTG